jgi:hypothetical protein
VHFLPLLLALAFASDPATASPNAAAVEVHDFAALKPERLFLLEGRRRIYRVRVVAVMEMQDGRALYHVQPAGENDCVLTLPNDRMETTLTVEAELRHDPRELGPARIYVLDKAERRP